MEYRISDMSKKVKVSIVASALVAVLIVGQMLAYFVSTDEAVNTFTIGKVEAELTEPSWNPDNAVNIVPRQEIAKDPQITNTGENDAYVFMEVTVPFISSDYTDKLDASSLTSIVEEELSNVPEGYELLFDFDVNNGWVLCEATREGGTWNGSDYDFSNGGFIRYTFAYVGGEYNGSLNDYLIEGEEGDECTINMCALKKGETTPALFNAVRLANIMENDTLFTGNDFNINVKSYAIQTTSLSTYYEESSDPIDGVSPAGQTAPNWVLAVIRSTLEKRDI